nr:Dagno [Scorpion polyomavirus 3]
MKPPLRKCTKKWKLIHQSSETFYKLLKKLHNPTQCRDLSPQVKFQMGLLLIRSMKYAETVTARMTPTDYSRLKTFILHTIYTLICSKNLTALKHLLTTYEEMQNWTELPKKWLKNTKIKKNLNKFYQNINVNQKKSNVNEPEREMNDIKQEIVSR